MLLSSDDGASVELRVVGYQYPATKTGGWDGNWLVIAGVVRAVSGAPWLFVDPCLTTWEARDLARWLREAAADRPTGARRLVRWLREAVADRLTGTSGAADRLVFVEPNVGFSVAARGRDTLTLRVHLAAEAAPPSPDGRRQAASDLDLSLTAADLQAAAVAWEENLADFPER
ncbi:hypothetical protein ACG83_02030 [Frankia sp. R43]|uniref:WapI family immunity protein n=1 Tax=Frankia sp. R43 TaxID=269536 RepID=UPI0006CA4A0C|nr:hypothetical protein [Frankia sp. R43]KPM56691.1 hypothetical protein ACG83_02030 [Frankia sp. R43]